VIRGAALRVASAPAPTDASSTLVGSLVKSRYRVDALASVSRDVAIYTGEDVRYSRPVVVSVLRGEVARDPEFIAALRAQASTLAMFAHLHRGVARVYECDATESGELFVAVERTEGVTLRAMLEARGPLQAPLALRLATRIGEALEALHHNHIVHGQLTPDSVIVVPTAGGTEHVTLVGVELTAAFRTPIGLRLRDAAQAAYRAPEQLEREETTEAADVYALGVLLREMLTASIAGQPAGPDAAPPSVPEEIERIIALAVAPEPELRYPDISVMLNDMWGAHTTFAEPELRPRSTTPKSLRHRRGRRRESHWALRIATAGVMVGLLAGVIWVGAERVGARSRAGVTAPLSSVPAGSRASEPAALEPNTRPASEVASESATTPAESTPAPAKSLKPAATTAQADAPTVTPPAPPPSAPSVVRPRPLPTAEPKERPPAPVASEPPRATTEPRRAVERRSPIDSRSLQAEDGSSAVDWLLQNRR
jgi:serine/threonine-protein kinase